MPVQDDHDAVTLDQFTRQAEPFASLHTARARFVAPGAISIASGAMRTVATGPAGKSGISCSPLGVSVSS